MICMVNDYTTWTLNGEQVKIGELWTFIGGHRAVLVDTIKEVPEYVGSGIGTQEVIYGATNYYNILGGLFLNYV